MNDFVVWEIGNMVPLFPSTFQGLLLYGINRIPILLDTVLYLEAEVEFFQDKAVSSKVCKNTKTVVLRDLLFFAE